jgi:hypothetical protein
MEIYDRQRRKTAGWRPPQSRPGRVVVQRSHAVMSHINAHARDKAYVALFSAKGLEPFYARYGFIARPIDKFGAGMFLIKGEKASEPGA